MKEIRVVMGMPCSVILPSSERSAETLARVFAFFADVDERFSPYKETSEVSRINRGEISQEAWSTSMCAIYALGESTKRETAGYFDMTTPEGLFNPSGIVKGWALLEAAGIVQQAGFADYFIEIGGDIQSNGVDENGAPWTVGVRNPFTDGEVVKILEPNGKGIATSGSYLRGDHIYNPLTGEHAPKDFVSLTVVGPDVFEADRFATAAYAMGRYCLSFIEALPGLEALAITNDKRVFMTSGFSALTLS